MRRAGPLSGAFHDGERLHLRLSGGEAGVAAAARGARRRGRAARRSGTRCATIAHPALAGDAPLWRLSLPQTAPIPAVGDVLAWDWAGAQVWLRSDAPAERIWQAAASGRRPRDAVPRRRAPATRCSSRCAPAMLALHQRLKAAFDPAGVLNPGRMYGAL